MTLHDHPSLFDLPRAEKERDEGIASVSSNNARFIQLMRAYAEGHAFTYGYVSSDECRAFAAANGLRPDHPNAWGAIFKKSPAPGFVWEAIGFKKSRIPSNHARRIIIWNLVKEPDE